jgi:hypothetical protein
MQRTELIALVAGMSVGLGGGTLGAFLACTACRAVARDVQEQYGYIDLGPPAPPPAAPVAQPVAPAAGDQNLPLAARAVSGAHA